MRHTEIDFDSFNGSSANGYNGRFNLQLPAGITYKEITLHGANLNNDQIRRVTLFMNGDLLIDVTGSVLRLIQRFKSDCLEGQQMGDSVCGFFHDHSGRSGS